MPLRLHYSHVPQPPYLILLYPSQDRRRPVKGERSWPSLRARGFLDGPHLSAGYPCEGTERYQSPGENRSTARSARLPTSKIREVFLVFGRYARPPYHSSNMN